MSYILRLQLFVWFFSHALTPSRPSSSTYASYERLRNRLPVLQCARKTDIAPVSRVLVKFLTERPASVRRRRRCNGTLTNPLNYRGIDFLPRRYIYDTPVLPTSVRSLSLQTSVRSPRREFSATINFPK